MGDATNDNTSVQQGMSNEGVSIHLVRPTAQNYGQLLFLEQTGSAKEQRVVMARVALAAAGFGAKYPLSIQDLVECLNSRNLLAVATFLTLVANAPIHWPPLDLIELKSWATPSTEGGIAPESMAPTSSLA